MQKLYISPTRTTPEVKFDPDENTFLIRGTSSPEDVRALYYPVIDWFRSFIATLLKSETPVFTKGNPLRLQIDLKYFNSSSAKFIYDIFTELKMLQPAGIPFSIEWYYEEEDPDMKEAGNDIAMIAELEFTYIEKKK